MYDDFEVFNPENTNLVQTLQYIKEFISPDILRKLKQNNFSLGDNSKSDVLKYFMNCSVKQGDNLFFRKKQDSDQVLTNIWISKVFHLAQQKILQSNTKAFNPESITKESLFEIAKLSYDKQNLFSIDDYLFNNFGIILVFLTSISGMKVDAVTYTDPSGFPVIGMSLRYKRYDHFWFTLMHELSHIFLHRNQINQFHVDEFFEENKENDTESSSTEVEIEANAFAKELLIPKKIWAKCSARRKTSDSLLREFSATYMIHPSIVAGFIRFEKQKHTIFSEFVNEIDVRVLLKDKL